MPATCVIGLQWGDEAKGKIVDLLTEQHDIVVRYQGGATPAIRSSLDGQTYKLSLIPSGILSAGRAVRRHRRRGAQSAQPAAGDRDALSAAASQVGKNLMISDSGPRDFSLAHRRRSAARTNLSGGEAIGTTMRGIGPCYRDKVGRSYAIRLGDMYRDDFRRPDRAHRRGQERRSSRGLRLRRTTSSSSMPQAIYRNTTTMPSGCGPTSPTRRPICSTPSRPASGCCSKARRGAAGHRSRHVPVRHQQQQLGRRRVQRVGRAGPL